MHLDVGVGVGAGGEQGGHGTGGVEVVAEASVHGRLVDLPY